MFRQIYQTGFIAFALAAACTGAAAQQLQRPQQISDPASRPAASQALQNANQQLRPNYVLGVNDQILIRAFEVDEINEKPFRIEPDGTITLPVIGQIKAAGLTVQELETDLVSRLKTYYKNPQVTIVIIQFRTEPVFFVGAFQKPGIYPLEGRRTLVEMLSSVGGLQPYASRRIKLTRRSESGTIPLPNAVENSEANVSTVEISMGSLRENVNPAEDISLEPYDVISVERAELVYIQGELGHTGAFELGERESISVLQVITLAGGLTRDADPEKARILRPVLTTSRRAEIPINLKSVLSARTNDYPLLPNDVLYVPRTKSRKQAFVKAAIIALPLIPTLIYLAIR
jgi:polysaccharide export outer membrane protein